MKPFYALGVNIAQQVGSELKTILSKEEVEVMLAGFSDAMTDKVVDDRELLMTYGKKLNEILESRSMADLENEKKKGDDFLVKYLLSNVRAVKTPSGMLYNEMFAGIGEQATAQSTVMVHYHGTLIDGTVFDSSVDRGAPIKFPLRNVIKGWQEGVAMMRAGGKATLVIPSELAYGDKGSPPVIPAGATLVFEVELLEIVA
jgi:FKBP-type peptidyl-prolyl cis-trans isomerase FkpA